jgi:peptidoglycan-associated lipoprotein
MELRIRSHWFYGLIYSIGLLMIVGCAKKIQTAQTTEVPIPSPKQEAIISEAPSLRPEAPKTKLEKPLSAFTPTKLGDIFFDFDKNFLRPAGRDQLDVNARWLKENANARITIEGHCDERGTGEYNLVLGEKRVETAKRYFESVGIDPGRIKTVNYGKERPFCQEHNEKCWQENRRDHFIPIIGE